MGGFVIQFPEDMENENRCKSASSVASAYPFPPFSHHIPTIAANHWSPNASSPEQIPLEQGVVFNTNQAAQESIQASPTARTRTVEQDISSDSQTSRRLLPSGPDAIIIQGVASDSTGSENVQPAEVDSVDEVGVSPLKVSREETTFTSTHHDSAVTATSYDRRWDEAIRELFRKNQVKASHAFGESTWKPSKYNEHLGRSLLAASTEPPNLTYHLDVAAKVLVMEGNLWVLNATQLQYARLCGIISKLHSITDDELADKGKGDSIAKALALLQFIWLIVQLSARAIHNRPSSPLEIATLALATVSFITYLILFYHPQDVKTPTTVPASRLPTANEMDMIAHMTAPSYLGFGRYKDHFIPNNDLRVGGFEDDWYAHGYFVAGIMLGSMLLGCIHLLAWNFDFPNNTERIMWIVSSFITALGPLVVFLVADGFPNILNKLFGGKLKYYHLWFWFWASACSVMVLVARLFILVEMFRSLYFSPPSVFLSSWTEIVPHAGS
ncbi:hypothetical protein PG999_001900 [Apiospora kogelbergensis]|uniref:Uncharacterized protein n=1 Tax=Apiospora kogelbergensis TaxID=1337665 RepID=A0AAW0R6T6_9PEZI